MLTTSKMIERWKIRSPYSGTAEDPSLLRYDALSSRRFKVSYCIYFQEKAVQFYVSALFLLINIIM